MNEAQVSKWVYASYVAMGGGGGGYQNKNMSFSPQKREILMSSQHEPSLAVLPV
jgi:hypothetical protein